MEDIRWQQRFENWTKAHTHYEELCQKDSLNWIEQTALIKVFEILFELSWKTLKDYLQEEGLTPRSPRETIKQAYQTGLVKEGETWLDALEKRNLLTHRYDEEFANYVTGILLNHYPPLFRDLKKELASRLPGEEKP